jgi:coenzyme F420-0:L-glutamate ligase/coenzyme F420-1:gamma-L-glutamate ligase
MVSVIPIPGIPRVRPGDDLPRLLLDALDGASLDLVPGDVVTVCQKVVSKAEGAVVALGEVTPSPFAERIAASGGKDPRIVEVILRESRRIVRMDRGHLICETGPGWICANAGVDASNTVGPDTVVLLPRNADASAAAIRQALAETRGLSVGVIVTDTFGRPWRTGLTEVALGVTGIEPFLDFQGRLDLDGRELLHTTIAIADEIACAAGLVMLKDSGIAAAIVRGAPVVAGPGGGYRFVRPAETDLFR